MANTREVAAFARSKMNEHGLTTWTFGFDRAVQRFGVCKYNIRTITLSEKLVRANSFEQCCDTVLHEIAHALTPGAKHGPAWRAACRRIGANPKRCYSTSDVVVVAKYRAFCEHCGDKVLGTRQQAPKGKYSCPKHKTEIVWKDARGRVVEAQPKGYVLVCGTCDAHLGTKARATSTTWGHRGCDGTVRAVAQHLINA